MKTILLFFCLAVVVENIRTYNRSQLEDKYPGYGEEYIFFPDENNKPFKVYLNLKHPRSKMLFKPDLEQDVIFTFYSRKLLGSSQKLQSIDDIPPQFDKTKPTKIITHGWMSGGSKDTCVRIKNSFLKKSDVNIFIMDWGKIADNILYPIPMQETTNVASYYAKFLNGLVDKSGVHPSDLHLIGHSLGAHISGFAGRQVRKAKVGRITGLDPALPGFDIGLVKGGRLSKDDSDFVDVIHTCAGYLGFKDPIGHVDFYPNGGVPPQPGCTLLELMEACSHGRSWKLFADSILIGGYNASRCDVFQELSDKSCDGDMIKMGEPVPKTARGIYYVKTSGKEPFLK